MIRKLLIVLSFLVVFLQSICISAEDFKHVEIFDPKQDKVVKIVQNSKQIQNMIISWITHIERMYKNDPATDDGYVVKIPIDPAVKVSSKSLNALVSEVYILIPESEPPSYLIFDDENNLLSLSFNGNVDMLSKVLDFKLKK